MRKPLVALAGAAAVFAAVGAGAATFSGFTSVDTIPMAATVSATCGSPSAVISSNESGTATTLTIDVSGAADCVSKDIAVYVNDAIVGSVGMVDTPTETVNLGQSAANLAKVNVVIADDITS